ncbi:MAG: hypothetical protein ACQEP6_00870 [Patescibacteria group bacterium]
MIWQDIVLSVGQWVFILALLPSLLSKDKPALMTSVITGTVLAVFAFTFSTLALWASAVSTGAVSLVWFILAFQKYRLIQREKKNSIKERVLNIE